MALSEFNQVDGDAPPGTPLGKSLQFESVANSEEVPSWFVNFNAWKFRQDWPGGNNSRVSKVQIRRKNHFCEKKYLLAE